MNIDEPFRDILDEGTRPNKRNRNTDQIEPWMDEPQTIPLYLLKTEAEKFTEKPLRIRKHVSL